MSNRTAQVVIGANFGDEGKGLAVDAIAARKAKPIVVRFNGGAQAGHTVVTPEGARHVFSHVGAGALAGATTFLSRFFVVHPGIFVVETAALAGLGVRPKVFVDPDAEVTTPLDILINRWVEETRGSARHGSVGIGFGETIERVEHGRSLKMRDLGDDDGIKSTLASLREEWLPERLATLGVAYTPERQQAAADAAMIERYLEAVRVLRHAVVPAAIDMALAGRDVIFEGAQGLLLDQDRGMRFPHVTRSNTGLKNVLALARDAGIGNLEVTYMTRAYLTRHGAGPLPHETGRLGFANVIDPTNSPNPWQGTLRFAPLDLDLLGTTIAADLSDARGTGVSVAPGIGMSCLDQITGDAEIVWHGRSLCVAPHALMQEIAARVGIAPRLEGWGPTRQTVRFRPDLSTGTEVAVAGTGGSRKRHHMPAPFCPASLGAAPFYVEPAGIETVSPA